MCISATCATCTTSDTNLTMTVIQLKFLRVDYENTVRIYIWKITLLISGVQYLISSLINQQINTSLNAKNFQIFTKVNANTSISIRKIFLIPIIAPD